MKSIVEQIHEEFNLAQTKLLLPCPNAAAEALYSFGFYKSKSTSGYDPSYLYLKNIAEYFQVNYPQYRFISEKQVQDICNKYNLVCAEVHRFLGEVPISKVAEITSFKIKAKDIRGRYLTEWNSIERGEVYSRHGSEENLTSAYGLWICAPESDIDMEGLTRVGHNVGEVVKDPIVLQPVQEGFIIVAAWGEEASDENVVNSKMN